MSLFTFGRPGIKDALPYDRGLWLGIALWLIFTGVAFSWGGWWVWENHLFAKEAQRTNATVLNKYSNSNKDADSRYHIVYGYQIGAVLVNSDTIIPPDIWNHVETGALIPIKYLPEKPQDNRIDGVNSDFQGTGKACLGLLLGTISVIFGSITSVHVYRRNQKHLQLLATGIRAIARVTSIETETSSDSIIIYLCFEFTNSAGFLVKGRERSLGPNQPTIDLIGKFITVFYDPADSTVFTVKPDTASPVQSQRRSLRK